MQLPVAYPVRLGQASDITVAGVELNPLLLAGGIVALLGASYLFGSGKSARKRKRIRKRIGRTEATLRRQRAQLTSA